MHGLQSLAHRPADSQVPMILSQIMETPALSLLPSIRDILTCRDTGLRGQQIQTS